MANTKQDKSGYIVLAVLVVGAVAAWNLLSPDPQIKEMEHAYTLTGYPAASCKTKAFEDNLWMGCKFTSKDATVSLWRELEGGWVSVNGLAHTMQETIIDLPDRHNQTIPVVVNGNGYNLGNVTGAVQIFN
ncbi:hypothetical protein GZ77_26785 [Endozoicomonas montiporae]|uniref:Uncharacterized protein n=1 Tax=Endozoicomonas montiporae TaxID=1027273 RepID=A0A081MYB8_9GAMM|nr:hypothetical protein [Endozoicomonas montiporae]KEQ11191.1 hypothetical protein GZ77_26785 [Endozoicomonas montiporae]